MQQLLFYIGCVDTIRKDIYIMSKTIESSGKYTAKDTGDSISYDFTFEAFDNIDDALQVLTEPKCLALIQRMVKVDANNTAREKAKSANGHSTRPVMSEEDKAKNKAERAENKALLEALRANPDLLAQLQG